MQVILVSKTVDTGQTAEDKKNKIKLILGLIVPLVVIGVLIVILVIILTTGNFPEQERIIGYIILSLAMGGCLLVGVYIAFKIGKSMFLSPKEREQMRTMVRLLEDQINFLRERIKQLEIETKAEIKVKQESWKDRQKRLLSEQEQKNKMLLTEIKESKTSMQDISTKLATEKRSLGTLEGEAEGVGDAIQLSEQEIREQKQRLTEDLSKEQQRLQIESENMKTRINDEIGNFETTWQNRMNQVELQKQQELDKLESLLEQEEERRLMLEEKRQLERTRQALQKQYEEKSFQSIEDAKSTLTKAIQDLKNLKRSIGIFKGQFIGLPNKCDKIISDFEITITDLDRQKLNVQSKTILLNSLNMINVQIQKLRNSLSYQRAAPAITVSNLQGVTLFSEINQIQFLCECCYTPVGEMTIKEYRKWVRWGLLGLKALVNITLSIGFRSLKDVIDIKISEKSVDKTRESIEKTIDKKLVECSQSYSKLLSTFLKNKENVEEYEGLIEDLGDLLINLKENKVDIEEVMNLLYLYFENIVKPGDFETVNKFLEEREKDIWNNFSHNEQEEIRKILKDTGNSNIFTDALTLKNGLYVCEKCANWLEGLEEYHAYEQIPESKDILST